MPAMPAMIATLRPASTRLLLLVAGVVLGLLAVALLVATHQSPAPHGLLVEGAKSHLVSQMRPLGVLWH